MIHDPDGVSGESSPRADSGSLAWASSDGGYPPTGRGRAVARGTNTPGIVTHPIGVLAMDGPSPPALTQTVSALRLAPVRSGSGVHELEPGRDHQAEDRGTDDP